MPLLPVRLSEKVDRLFDELIYRLWGVSRAREEGWNLQIDLYETDAAFILEADLPGIKAKDVSVEVADNDLVLKGHRSLTRMTTQGSVRYYERRSGHRFRSCSLQDCSRLMSSCAMFLRQMNTAA
jgi:HSP20 family protein